MNEKVDMLKSEFYIKNPCGIGIDWEYCLGDINNPHLHTYYTIDLVIEGEGKHIINGNEYELKQGCVHLVLPSDIHYMYAVNNSKVKLTSIRFNETAINDVFLSILPKIRGEFFADEKTFNRLRVYAETVADYLEKSGEFALSMVQANFSSILMVLAELSLTKEFYYPKKDTVETALYYMHMHFRENISLKQTADFVGLSPEYFSYIFKREMGKTYTEHLKDLKVDFACQMLKNDFNVTEVCFFSGFGSISNFNNSFKKKMKISPTEYRKRIKKEE